MLDYVVFILDRGNSSIFKLFSHLILLFSDFCFMFYDKEGAKISWFAHHSRFSSTSPSWGERKALLFHAIFYLSLATSLYVSRIFFSFFLPKYCFSVIFYIYHSPWKSNIIFISLLFFTTTCCIVHNQSLHYKRPLN